MLGIVPQLTATHFRVALQVQVGKEVSGGDVVIAQDLPARQRYDFIKPLETQGMVDDKQGAISWGVVRQHADMSLQSGSNMLGKVF